MKVTRVCAIALCVLTMSLPVSAADHPTFQNYWQEATTCDGSSTREYTDFMMVVCDKGFTFYYFTKPNHPAHPGVIKRMMVQKDGAWVVQEEGHSYASDAAQPAFSAWLEQFKELDRQMMEDIARRHSAGQTSSN